MNATSQKRGRVALVGVAILALAAGAVVLGFHSATAADDHGNTLSSATPIAPNVPNTGTLDSFGDQDVFVLPAIPPGYLRIVASGQAFAPHIEVYDGRQRRIAEAPGAGTTMQGPFTYSSPVPRTTVAPLYFVVAPAGRIGSYQFVLAIGTGEPADPSVTDLPPVEPVPPPPGPGTPTDDVPAGAEIDLTGILAFDGHIEISGDLDAFKYVTPIDGPYEIHLLSEMPDAVADAALPLTFHVNSWIVAPYTETFPAGTEIHLTVHSLSELSGPYRIEVTPPPGAPTEPPPPPPPLPEPDLLLTFDPVAAMPPKAAKDYRSWLQQNYRFSDPSVNGELISALGLRQRWIQREDAGSRLRPMLQDPTGALGGALVPFGGKSGARTRFPQWVRTQLARTTPGGGTLVEIRAVIEQSLAQRRPLLLLGRRQGDGLAEAWVVFGLRTIGGVPNLVVVDPSTVGQTIFLPLGPAGILPVGSGGASIRSFSFLGLTSDVISP